MRRMARRKEMALARFRRKRVSRFIKRQNTEYRIQKSEVRSTPRATRVKI
jgi:hypothetical protein